MYSIYVLKCPISNEVRYVGQTRGKLNKRLDGHIWESRKNKKKHSHKDNWISKLSKLELKPIIEKWDYAKECAEFYKISRGNISTASKFNSSKNKDDKYIICSGFIFSFTEI